MYVARNCKRWEIVKILSPEVTWQRGDDSEEEYLQFGANLNRADIIYLTKFSIHTIPTLENIISFRYLQK